MEHQPGHQPSADDALIARIAEGDEEALGALYDRHSGPAFSLAYGHRSKLSRCRGGRG